MLEFEIKINGADIPDYFLGHLPVSGAGVPATQGISGPEVFSSDPWGRKELVFYLTCVATILFTRLGSLLCFPSLFTAAISSQEWHFCLPFLTYKMMDNA